MLAQARIAIFLGRPFSAEATATYCWKFLKPRALFTASASGSASPIRPEPCDHGPRSIVPRLKFVIFVNGAVMLALAVFMGLTALLFRDTGAVFGVAALTVGLVGGLVMIANGKPDGGLKPLHAFLLTSSVWIVAATAGAVPLAVWGMSPVDALFESMSGITTTGSTVMTGLDTTPRGILFWRAVLQALGGIGFIVTGVALLPILKVGGMQLFRTESSEKGEKELANAARFAGATVTAYGFLMGLCAILYGIGGMSPFDALTHAMTTLSTGGYSTYDASFGHFDSAFLEYTATLFMLLGGLPFAWYIRVALKGRVASEQVTHLVIFVLGISVLLTIWLVSVSEKPLETAFREVVFNVVSVVTTTGYATADYTTWGTFSVAVFFALTAVGGCTGSTAGGAKMMRWIVFFRLSATQIRTVHSPHAVIVARYEGRRIEDDVVSGVVTFFTFYFGTIGLLAVALALVGLDMETAVGGALTSVANVGPGVGGIIGPAGNFQPLNDAAKLILAFGMFLGRLELLTVFVLFTPLFWREL
ncbi:TrkH family potassium uptake protein [Sagittula sp. MA-2]|jgi:trk system potassium uptake protein TrkH|uniref:TrkH family potassium uptake protein n=1 Tax=Sagittula sp. MA-2 TaxID=3048007 RepID=UPI0024C2C471|nr:TrkH family potassium uptake protein [Sagittula sp. MA-2]WHZ38194.1 TrkH family potassium uptake protein [Sagittula sp. MA-2]